MTHRPIASALGFAAIVASGAAASSAQQPAGRQAVYVVAVKDSGVLTMCPTDRAQTAKASAFADGLQLMRFPARESGHVDRDVVRELRDDPRFRTELGRTQAILPLPWAPTAVATSTSERAELGRDRVSTDIALEAAVELELLRTGRVDVVDSPAAADVVLLAEGTYVALATSVTTDDVSREPDEAPPPLGTATHVGDWPRNVLQSILAIAVPAERYRATGGETHALLAARTWEGSEVYQPPYQVRESSPSANVMRWETQRAWRQASPEAVVWQFLQMKPRPASHPPLCAASGPGITVETSEPPAPTTQGPMQSAGIAVTSREEPREPMSTFIGAVTYVSVPVTVTDGLGRPMRGFDASRFRVYEDDTLQAIDRVDPPGAPVDVLLLVDSSASLRHQSEAMRAGTIAAISAFDRLGELSIVSFDRRVVSHSRLPDQFMSRRPGIQSPSVGRSATRLYDAIELVLASPRKDATRRRAMVIMTDGADTASRLADADSALRRLGESHVPVYVVHYDTSQDNVLPVSGSEIDLRVNDAKPEMRRVLLPSGADDPRATMAHATRFLMQVATATGGRLLPATGADGSARTFASIADELRGQYTIAYYPRNQRRDGTYRQIRVEADGLEVNVRARAGYYQASSVGISR